MPYGGSASRSGGRPAKRRKTLKTTSVAEVKFDDAAREEFLTGFHKRKVARAKAAQEEAARREKEERVRGRREVSFLLFCCSVLWRGCGRGAGGREVERMSFLRAWLTAFFWGVL